MIFEFSLTVDAGTTQAEPEPLEMPLARGIIHKIEVIGDGGEHNTVLLVIQRALHQVFPINPDGQFHPGFFPISYPVWYALEEAPYVLKAYAWSPTATYSHEVIIRLGMERREVLEPGREALGFLGKFKEMIFGKG